MNEEQKSGAAKVAAAATRCQDSLLFCNVRVQSVVSTEIQLPLA